MGFSEKLMQKSFELSKAVRGGLATFTDCSVRTDGGGGCGDVRNTTTTDHGKVLSDSTVSIPCNV